MPDPQGEPARPLLEIGDEIGLVPAPTGRRAAAFAIDLVFAGVFTAPALVAILLRAALPPAAVLALIIGGTVLPLAVATIQAARRGARGATLGSRILGLCAVDPGSLEPSGFGRAFLRGLVLVVAGIVPVLGPLVLLASSTWAASPWRRGWLDEIGRAVFLDVRAGLDPRDATALRRARRAAELARVPPPTTLPSLATGADGSASFVPAERLRASVVMAASTYQETTVDPVTADALPVGAVAPPADRPPSTPAELVADDGTRVVVRSSTVVGRDPSPADGHGALAIPDPGFSMSKAHALVELDAGGLLITDLRSSNGTSSVAPDGSTSPIGDERALVPWGSTVVFGRLRFQVRQSVGGGR